MYTRNSHTGETNKKKPQTVVLSHLPYKLHSQFRHSTFGMLASLKHPMIQAIVFSPILRPEGLEHCHKLMHIATH